MEKATLEKKFEPEYKTIYLRDHESGRYTLGEVLDVINSKLGEVYNPESKEFSKIEKLIAKTLSELKIDYSFRESTKIFSPIDRSSYDKDRHISVEDSYKLLESQGDPYLNREKLDSAINNGEIEVYDFKDGKFLDRLDIGRVYHKAPEKKEGLTVEKYFTKQGEDPFDSVKHTVRNLKIDDFKTKETIFEIHDAEFPEWIDDDSAKIVAQKYFFNPYKEEWKEKIKDKLGREREFSMKHLNKRVADFFAEEGWKLGYFKTEEDRETFRNELYFIQINGIAAFNSPTQFNAGLFNSYGIEGSPGINFFKNSETGKVEKVLNGEYIHPQLHACFIKGPNDNLESIAQEVIDEIAIFGSGSGIGHDIGKLRAEGERLSGGGSASGALSFFGIYDKIAGTIKSGGKTRRAARMTTMGGKHPDVMKFVRGKVQEDKKALILMQNGYSTGMDGEAYRTVAFQNTNLSVRLDDEFFDAINNNGDVQFYTVKENKPVGKISAQRMLKEIAFGSWRIGDPAIQYEDKIQEMHTGKNSGKQNSTNPCSEYLYIDDTSCNLSSSRLTYFVKEDGTFDVDGFKKTNEILAIASNISNESASYPVKEIALVSPEFATIGVGYADLGSLLMRKGISYNSEEGRAIAGAITALMTGTVYEVSTKIAEAKGTFTHFEFNKKPMIEVMEKHKTNLENILWDSVNDDGLKKAAYDSWKNVIERGQIYGFSNAQATVLAPTGTISYLMGCNTTGVEPALSLSIIKNLAGGGNITLTNRDVEIALSNIGYSPEDISDISKYVGKYNTLRNAPHVKPEHYSIFDTAFGNSKGEGSIEFEGHVRMLGATQPFISGAISKTNNLPESATVREIYNGYLLGHELGLKAISIFRNNSKPISAVDFGGKSYKKLKRGEKEELPFSGDSFRQEVKIDGTPFLITIGEYVDGRPGEIVINSYTSDSTLGAMLRLAGISASSALKRGSSLEDTLKGWVGHGFEPKGFVTIENPEGKVVPHPYIKQANSPLDFVGKLLLLHYKGKKEFATEPEKVEINNLRGFKNGAFKAYHKMSVDDWDIEQVLKDPELGGFANGEFGIPAEEFLQMMDKIGKESTLGFIPVKLNGNGRGNSHGRSCRQCGRIMMQTGANCFECQTCGDKVGGCGA